MKQKKKVTGQVSMNFPLTASFFEELEARKTQSVGYCIPVRSNVGTYVTETYYFSVNIVHRRKLYAYERLKVHFEEGVNGFSFETMPNMQFQKTHKRLFGGSSFLKKIDFTEDEFVSAVLTTDETGSSVTIQTKKYKAIISWDLDIAPKLAIMA